MAPGPSPSLDGYQCSTESRVPSLSLDLIENPNPPRHRSGVYGTVHSNLTPPPPQTALPTSWVSDRPGSIRIFYHRLRIFLDDRFTRPHREGTPGDHLTPGSLYSIVGKVPYRVCRLRAAKVPNLTPSFHDRRGRGEEREGRERRPLRLFDPLRVTPRTGSSSSIRPPTTRISSPFLRTAIFLPGSSQEGEPAH